MILEEAAEAAFRDKVAVAVATERSLIAERKQREVEGEGEDGVTEEKRDESEVADVVRAESRELQRKHTKVASECRYGPAFPLAFNKDESEDSVDSNTQGV